MSKMRTTHSGDDVPPSLPSVPSARLVGHEGPVHVVRFTADGKYCITAGQDRTVRLWNPVRIDPAHAADSSAPFLRDDYGDAGRKGIAVRDLPPALPIQSYEAGHSHPIHAVAIDSGSTTLLSTSERSLVVTDVVTRRVQRRLHGHSGRINCVASSAGAETYLSGSYDGTVRIWDGRSRSSEPIQILGDANDSVTSVHAVQSSSLSSSSSSPSSVGGGGKAEIVTSSVDGKVRTYDLRAGHVAIDDLSHPITSMCLSDGGGGGGGGDVGSGDFAAAACLDGAIRLWDRSSGVPLRSCSGGHAAGRYGLGCAFAPDGSFVVSGSEDGAAVLYDVLSGKIVQRLEGHVRPTCSVACSPRASVLVTASYDGEAVVWCSREEARRMDWGSQQ